MQLLGEAQALFKNGNYPAAKQLANEAKAGKFGVDAQADELIAQANLAEQGGALEPLRDGPGGPSHRRQRPGTCPPDRGRRGRRLARRGPASQG